MKRSLLAALLAAALPAAGLASDPPKPASNRSAFKLKPKKAPRESDGAGLLAPDPELIDVPTSAVIDYGGYGARSRFFSRGGMLQHVTFGVYQGVSLGGSLTLDGLIGSDQSVRLRTPNAQVKWRFYDGDGLWPSLAVGFDGQGYLYNLAARRYNQRQRGFYLASAQELGLPGLQAHPSIAISDVDSSAFGAAIPFSYNVKDKALVMFEWDNINDFHDSRVNAGLRAYVTSRFSVDFAVRAIGQGGAFANGDSRGPERIVQLRYSASF